MKKIDRINELLNDDLKLEKYLQNLDKKEIDIPSKLNNSILNKVNTRKKLYYFNILKIAACLIFTLAICRTDFIKNDNLVINKYEKKQEYSKFQEKVSDICVFLRTPLNIERKEK